MTADSDRHVPTDSINTLTHSARRPLARTQHALYLATQHILTGIPLHFLGLWYRC